MKVKITPFTTKHSHLEGVFRVDNNHYLAKYHSAGMVTAIRKDDDWLDQEMCWVSRSDIPFITALRHVQLQKPHLVEGVLTPNIKRFTPFYFIEEFQTFPSTDECMQLIYKYCDFANDGGYHFYQSDIKEDEIAKIYELFDYKNDFFVRAGSCLYKAYILLNTSHTFAEEIYVNVFIAFEALVQHLKLDKKLNSREDVIDVIDSYVKKKQPGIDFKDYEKEMRNQIRNNIIHPLRTFGGYKDEKIAQPFMMADYVFEDLGFVDWLFKKFIEGELRSI